jgi:hypothetical protein
MIPWRFPGSLYALCLSFNADDLNFHIDFLTAATNMRSWNYDIKESARHTVKVTAGRSEYASQRVLILRCIFRCLPSIIAYPPLTSRFHAKLFPFTRAPLFLSAMTTFPPCNPHMNQMLLSSPFQRPPTSNVFIAHPRSHSCSCQ